MRSIHQIFLAFLLSISLLLVAGCASIMAGSPSTLTVNSVPKDVTVTIMGGGTTTVQHTPCSIILNKQNDYTVTLEYQGYRSEQIVIQRTINGWVWGNILFGGIIGLAVDGITGNMWDHNIHAINRELVKAQQTGILPDKVTVDYPIYLIQENGQQVVQYLPVTFFKII